jgi:hypothetical protein
MSITKFSNEQTDDKSIIYTECNAITNIYWVSLHTTEYYIWTSVCYKHTHIFIHASMHTYKHMHIHTYTHIHIYIHTHTHIHTYIHTYIHTHIRVHTYMHTHTHTHTHIHTLNYIHRNSIIVNNY